MLILVRYEKYLTVIESRIEYNNIRCINIFNLLENVK